MRPACFVLGLATLALVWFGPLLTVWRSSFAAHMLAHMGVVAIAAPLIAVGATGLSFSPFIWPKGSNERQRESRRSTPSLVLLPASPSRGENRWWSLGLSLPIIASLIELIVVWGWHAPAARVWAENSTFATMFEQTTFLAAGLLLWLSCLGAGQLNRSACRAAGAFGLLLTTVHMTLLGALLALSPRPLYGLAEASCFGLTLSAEQDQQLGAVVMLFVGAVAYLAGGLALLAKLLATPARRTA